MRNVQQNLLVFFSCNTNVSAMTKMTSIITIFCSNFQPPARSTYFSPVKWPIPLIDKITAFSTPPVTRRLHHHHIPSYLLRFFPLAIRHQFPSMIINNAAKYIRRHAGADVNARTHEPHWIGFCDAFHDFWMIHCWNIISEVFLMRIIRLKKK